MASDVIQQIGKSRVQHGHFNNRVYVIRLSQDDIPDIIRSLDELVRKEGYTKIFVKVPESSMPVFTAAGYVVEATVPFFYHGHDTAVFMAKYFDPGRNRVADSKEVAEVLSAAFGYAQAGYTPRLPEGLSLVYAHAGDAKEIAALYRTVFETYPFPISDPEFISKNMKEDVRYFCVRRSKRIVAVASCEVSTDALNAEMTDFATDPQFQGKGLAGNLLHAMETDVKKDDIRLAYTIARAISYPINMTFARAGYQYAGVLPNNTNISGAMESMNVWYKRL
ncbi:MAG: putative beta-lysine N-acetyltransferase [Methanoregula sp.]|nr:MAG: putative beta-lysine N-acetyltransferase [Methanoregula sp.]